MTAGTTTPSGRTRRRVLTAQLSAPVRRFLSTETGSTGLLLGAAVVALVWANSAWSAAYEALWGTVGAISLGGAELSMDLGTGSTTG